MPPNRVTIQVREEHEELRLDQLLAAEVPDLSRRKARTLIDIGGVFLDGKRVKVASRKLRRGQRVVVTLGAALREASPELGRAARDTDDERLPRFELVHEDEDVLVVMKPSGLHSVPTPESDRGNLLDQLERRGATREPLHVIHRLDMETSGLLVFARNASAARRLEQSLAERAMSREYVAVLRGAVPFESERVASPIRGKASASRFHVTTRFGELATEVRVELETGRTHQIRIHAASIGHPVLADRRYGTPTDYDPPRMALHAVRLSFPHPKNGEPRVFEAPVPADLVTWEAELGARTGRGLGVPGLV